MTEFKVDTTVVDSTMPLNGQFRLSVNSLDYRAPIDDAEMPWYDYFSTTLVRVLDGNVIVVDLLKAAQELHDQTGYWGRYIESLEYRQDSDTIEVSFGS